MGGRLRATENNARDLQSMFCSELFYVSKKTQAIFYDWLVNVHHIG